MLPEISVVIPVYNREKYISRCVESVLCQSFDDFELILVDDGSTDKSADICDECALKDERVKVIHKKNGGVSSARNAGINASNGKYIAFVDSDDYVEKDFLKCAFDVVSEHDVDVFISGIAHDYCNLSGDKFVEIFPIKKDGVFNVKELFEMWGSEIPLDSVCGPCCKLYKLDVIKSELVLFDTSMSLSEDTCFNLDVMKKISKAYLSESVFYHYCKNEGEETLVSSLNKDIYEINSKVYSNIRNQMRDSGCSEQSMIRLENRYFTALLGGLHSYYAWKEKTTLDERKKLIKKISYDKYVRICKVKHIKNKKEKVLLLLFKLKCYGLIMLIFDAYYKKRSQKT